MSNRFVTAKPLQAGKLVGILGALGFAVVGLVGIVPDQQSRVLLLVAFLGPVLTLVILVEALVAGYRAARAPEPATDRLTARPAYTAVRTGEFLVAGLTAGTLVGSIATLPGEPVPELGAMGLLFVGVLLGLLVLVASLVRTLAEYYYHRRSRAA